MADGQAKGHEDAGGVVKQAEAVGRKEVPAGTATQMQVLIGPEDGAPNFAMRRFIMGEGGGVPTHTNKVEHEQFVLRGRAEVGIGNKVYDVQSGDVVYIPAGVPHYYKVREAPFEFLCMVPNTPDQLKIVGDDR
ncbi:MAG TPA: cupin domain-containing protein [Terriglobia bacterium]|nr:cupin domain-containing protein [Terriglobia bacterium]